MPVLPTREAMSFLDELKEQRWDDHRLYHHSRINQSLHLLSALSFLTAYVLLAVQPGIAALVGWLVAMWSRQIGHFFFEPKDFDEVNQLSHERKEEIKVGYNLRRKVVLLSIWALSPLAAVARSGARRAARSAHADWIGFVDNVALMWLVLGAAGLLFRTVQLFFIRSVQTGLVWCTKILTDPFHDVQLYHKSPLYLLRGELIDPMHHVHVDGAAAEQLADDERRARRKSAQAGRLTAAALRRPNSAASTSRRIARRIDLLSAPAPSTTSRRLASPRRPRRSARRRRGSPRPCSCG